jgi:hypothetical protein
MATALQSPKLTPPVDLRKAHYTARFYSWPCGENKDYFDVRVNIPITRELDTSAEALSFKISNDSLTVLKQNPRTDERNRRTATILIIRANRVVHWPQPSNTQKPPLPEATTKEEAS